MVIAAAHRFFCAILRICCPQTSYFGPTEELCVLKSISAIINPLREGQCRDEMRRSKKGESRIEEVHMLRLLYNQLLKWRLVNATSNAVLMVQSLSAEKELYNTWLTSSNLYDTVTVKKFKLQILTHDLKQAIILKGQMVYLEEWFNLEIDHSSSLSGAIEALKASTLCLPVLNGTRAELQEVKDAVRPAVDVMQAMGASICS